MKIYTKTGDDGTTGLFGSGRVSKNSARIEAYGTVDELNSVIGLVAAQAGSEYFRELMVDIQKGLFVLGADLATPLDSKTTYAIPRVEEADVKKLELAIDQAEAGLPPLEKFILPGGTALSACFHLARTVGRRAERRVVALAETEHIGPFDIQFLNRLSDLFFVLARKANTIAGMSDIEWDGKKA
ncbi:MAG: cob(I)yrinic acid a,c-diamide adenosyltransferase [Bacteroidota bacterium]|nr:cob(I)yrinic acid a,c-diamide adenosyltransferase [Bacteroidota bacterium]